MLERQETHENPDHLPSVGCFLLTLLVLLLLFSGSRAVQAQRVTADKSLCYAFLLSGDLWTNCNGEKRQITRFDDVEDFAVDSSGRTLALIRYQKKIQGKARFQSSGPVTYFDVHEALQLLDLSHKISAPLHPLSAPMELRASCGTILSITWDNSTADVTFLGLVQDAVTGERIRFEPYRNFRCSSDRKAVVGWIDPKRTILKRGMPPGQDLVDPHQDDELEYDVSPNGRYIAFSTFDSDQICVSEGTGQLACTHPGADTFRVSVSDSGQVLYAPNASEGCYYKDSMHASTEPRPGYAGRDDCRALSYWKPGEAAPKRLELLATDPQWITPEAAASLHAWNSKRPVPPPVDSAR